MIYIKTPDEIKIMREGGIILAKIIKKLEEAVVPGITTQDIEKLARELVYFYKVKPAFLGYDYYPAATCVSINEEVVHCLPSDRIVNEGDLVSIDMGIIYKGFNLDSALTVPALKKGDEWRWSSRDADKSRLIEVTRKALELGISKIKAGRRSGAIGSVIAEFVEKNGLSVIKELTGHGIGRSLHEEPQIPNFGRPDEGVELKEGMVIAIEPIISTGDWRLVNNKDGFGYNTKDGSLAAHFEHTIAIGKSGPLILTKE